MMIKGYEITAKAFAIAVAVALVAFLIWFGPSQCAQRKTAEKQAEVSAGAGAAAIGSGEEAARTTSNVAASDDATDAAVAAGQAEIAHAAAGQKVAAAKRAACRLKTYRDTPQCKETAK